MSTRTAGWASRHGARAKEFAPRKKALLGEGIPTRRTGEKALLRESIPTRRTSEKICPAQECSPRRRHPDTAHERKDLPAREHAPRRRPPDTARRRKNLSPRENTPLGEGLPTRRTSERICPAQEHAPRRRPPDTAHEQKNLPRARTLSSAKASRHGARAKGFVPRGFAFAPRADERRAALDRRTAEKHPFGGVAPERARPLPSSFTEKNKTTP